MMPHGLIPLPPKNIEKEGKGLIQQVILNPLITHLILTAPLVFVECFKNPVRFYEDRLRSSG